MAIENPLFDEDEKKIFKYKRNGEDYFQDPLIIEYELDAAAADQGCVLDEICKQMKDDRPQVKRDAALKLVPIICQAFGLTPFDNSTGLGTTPTEAIDIYISYFEFVGDVKKNTGESPPTSQPSGSESTGRDGPEATGESPTNSGSEST